MSEQSCRITFIRHGATDWNLEKRYLGHTDLPLNETGRLQAREVAEQLEEITFDAVYSSDLKRAFQTAQIVTGIIGRRGSVSPEQITPDQRLREMHFGLIEGMTYEQAMEKYPEETTRWYEQAETLPPPGATEAMTDVRNRMVSFMRDVVDRGYKNILIFTHGGAIKAWRSYAEQIPFWDITIKHGQSFSCTVGKDVFK